MEFGVTKRDRKPMNRSMKEQEEFHQLLHRDVDATIESMRRHGKVVLNADDLFMLMPRYAEHPEERIVLGPLLYPVAREATDFVFDRLLSRPCTSENTVVFTAGGSATGKSTILGAAVQQPGIDFVVDTTFSNEARASLQVRKALDAGRMVEVHFVYRDFRESVEGMIQRALDPKSGRIVPIDDMARTHFGAPETVLAVASEYRNEVRVSFRLHVNRGGKLSPLKPTKMHFYDSVDELRELGQNILHEHLEEESDRQTKIGSRGDGGRKSLRISQSFYEAARSKAQD